MTESKILVGRDNICKYLGITKNKFYDLLKEGLPVRRVGLRGWLAHKEDLDNFFKSERKE